MHALRRLYVYLLSGISLGVLVAGLSLLLGVVFEQLGVSPGEIVTRTDVVVRERLTLATALTAVALPVWLIHWFVAERGVRPERPGSEAERTAGIRGLYFALVLGGLLLAAATSAASLVEAVVLGISGERSFHDSAGSLGLLVVALGAWAYHARIRLRDHARGPVRDEAAWLPRLYLYLAAFAGLMVLAFGITGLAELVGRLILNAPIEFGGARWWASPLATGAAQIVVGGAVWTAHWWQLSRMRVDSGWLGASERIARLRLAHYVAVLVVAAAAVIGYLGQAGRDGIQAVLGISDLSGTQLAGSILVALASAAVFAVAWLLHAAWLRGEAAGADAQRRETARRLDAYPVALVGLAFASVALAWLVGLLIDVLFGGGRTLVAGAGWQTELSEFVPLAVLGTALWAWQWSRVGARHAAEPEAEASSTVRRGALFLVLAVGVVALIGGAGTILYRLFGILFGLELAGNTVSELSTPIGIVLVALVVGGYHAALLRRDEPLRRGAPAPAEAAAPAVVLLRLSAPPGVDVSEVADRLRAQLPPGYSLEAVAPGRS
jgi:hypothetical protein